MVVRWPEMTRRRKTLVAVGLAVAGVLCAPLPAAAHHPDLAQMLGVPDADCFELAPPAPPQPVGHLTGYDGRCLP